MKELRFKPNLQFFAQEKTEKATPRKRQEAREKGQVARSAEIPSAVIFLFVFMFLYVLSGFMGESLRKIITQPLSEFSLWELTVDNLQVIFLQLLFLSMQIVLPLFLITLVAGIFANYIQIGFLFTTETLKMKLERLNPIEGAKRIFSLRALVELVKSIFKILLVSFVVFNMIWQEKEQILLLSQRSIEQIFSYVGNLVLKMGINVAILLVVLAIFDYLYQRYEYEKNLRMSKQEIKDEHKKIEGDPLIKNKIRERQRQMAMRRMMQEIPKADVVITNPTHFAVAIQYQAGKMDAPIVVAKGQDYIALKIREIATEHGITIMENKPLARALYQRVEIGQAIPEDLFRAVAEVLAYVYRLKGVM